MKEKNYSTERSCPGPVGECKYVPGSNTCIYCGRKLGQEQQEERGRPEIASANEITTAEGADEWRAVIGEQNYSATLRALDDKARIWVFRSEEEIDKSELSEEEKRQTKEILREEKLGWAGWIRPGKAGRAEIRADEIRQRAMIDLLNIHNPR